MIKFEGFQIVLCIPKASERLFKKISVQGVAALGHRFVKTQEDRRTIEQG